MEVRGMAEVFFGGFYILGGKTTDFITGKMRRGKGQKIRKSLTRWVCHVVERHLLPKGLKSIVWGSGGDWRTTLPG